MCFVFFFICGKNSIRLVRRIILIKMVKDKDKYKKIQANLKMMRKSFSVFIFYMYERFVQKNYTLKNVNLPVCLISIVLDIVVVLFHQI